MSEDLFAEIYGYEDVKQLFTLSIKSEKPIGILLCGVPASGKTLFLMSLMRLPKSKYYLGGQTSKAGLTEVLLKEKPDYLIIDESLIGENSILLLNRQLDKMASHDFDALLSLMETGKVVRCKMRLWAEEQLNTKVYGACNRLDRIPPELLSRFLVVEFKPYTPEEFINVSKHVLKVREGLTEEEADKIARLLVDSTRDVRDSVKAGRLLKSGASIEFIEKFFRRNSKQKTLTW
jgi:Holliday junction DNA helicase RuvB